MKRNAWILAVVTLAATACGGSHSTSGDGGSTSKPSNSAVSTYFTSSRDSACAYVVNCCQPATNNVTYATVADCQAAEPVATTISEAETAIAGGIITFDETAAKACNATQAAWAAACAPTVTQALATELACANVAVGNVDVGGACAATADFCKPSLFCNTTTGQCEARTATGGVCGSIDSSGNATLTTCVAGDYCQTGGQPDDLCIVEVADGSPCMGSLECASGYCGDDGNCAEHPDYTLLDLCTSSTGTKM